MRTVQFDEVYEPVLALWPESISLADHGPFTTCPDHERCGPSQYFPTLSRCWDGVEHQVRTDDPWREQMVWTLFQEFHHEAVALVARGTLELRTRAVAREAVERRYFENLHGEEWSEFLAQYQRPAERDTGASSRPGGAQS